METVAFCEADEKCRDVLAKHWPDIPIHHDVRELTGDRFDDVGLICGGFPCQPFSLAGKRGGENDDRHLWPEMFRLIREVRPRWVIGENVAGIITMGLDEALSDLEEAGYSCWSFVVPACAVDAPHRRDRVWIIAHDDSAVWSEPVTNPGRIDQAEPVHDGGTRSMAYGIFSRLEGLPRHGDGSDEPGRDCQETGRPVGETGVFGGRSAAEGWLPEPGVGRVANGVSGRVDRLKQLGNSVVPQLVTVIGSAILEADSQNFPGAF